MACGEDVEAGSVGEVDVAHGADALEQLEVAVDRGGVELQLARELLGGRRAVRSEQCLEDEPACGGEP